MTLRLAETVRIDLKRPDPREFSMIALREHCYTDEPIDEIVQNPWTHSGESSPRRQLIRRAVEKHPVALLLAAGLIGLGVGWFVKRHKIGGE